MTTESKIILSAEFNPKIRSYFLVFIALFMTITIVGIPLLIIWFLGLGQYISKRFYENLKCDLTNRHLEFKKGVLFKIEKTIPLENIQDITFIENPLLKYFDLRILKIETAGHSNPHGSDMKLVGIIKTQEFKNKILQQRDVLKTEINMDKTIANPSKGQIVNLLLDIKDILNEIKNK